MALVATTAGVSSIGITGDGNDRLELVGDGVDAVRLVSRLRRKLGHAEILQVEEVKEKKPEEKKDKKPEEPKAMVVHPLPHYTGYYHHYPPPPVVVYAAAGGRLRRAHHLLRHVVTS